MSLSIHGSLSAAVSAACCREAEGVAFHTAEILPVAGVLLRTSVPRGLAATQRLRCRRRQLPQALRRQLPRGGRVGRVLPAVVADTAKAEGVALGRSAARGSSFSFVRLLRELPSTRTGTEPSQPSQRSCPQYATNPTFPPSHPTTQIPSTIPTAPTTGEGESGRC